jgi:hypothetical protein
MTAHVDSYSFGPDLTPEVLCTCSCGRIHTREAFEQLDLVTSKSCPEGRIEHAGDVIEFRRCNCDSTIAARVT